MRNIETAADTRSTTSDLPRLLIRRGGGGGAHNSTPYTYLYTNTGGCGRGQWEMTGDTWSLEQRAPMHMILVMGRWALVLAASGACRSLF
jgi:hypothetical protein